MMENHLLNEKIPQSHNIRGCYQKKNSRQVQLQVFSSLISGIAALAVLHLRDSSTREPWADRFGRI